MVAERERAAAWAASCHFNWNDVAPAPPAEPNELETFFDRKQTGPGIWKWRHYFDIYERHFKKFRGREVHVLEIGIYSGGSLDMWREYFGPNLSLYGVDIEPACRVYEHDGVKVFIGDQADRKFWLDVRSKIPALDIVIDDGGHLPEQQIVSLEELLPYIRPGGVYLCEDVHQSANPFASYVHTLGHKLNDTAAIAESQDAERRLTVPCSSFQQAIGSIHLYPFVTVLERNAHPRKELCAPKHGTQWQPFLK